MIVGLAFANGACVWPSLPPGVVASVGGPAHGFIVAHGVSLPDSGPGYVRARPGEDTRFGSPVLVEAITHAAQTVAETFPTSHPIRVGDLSAPYGGRHARHHSHRSGRDADIIYYAMNESGDPMDGAGFYAYDRFGVARDGRDPRAPLQFLDEARTWRFMRTLLLDDERPIQWIFCSAGVKTRLMTWALANERDPEVIWRATYVLHQPTDGRPHDDHFHIRMACTPRMRAEGCLDAGPVWPWTRARVDKTEPELPFANDDVSLLHALLDD